MRVHPSRCVLYVCLFFTGFLVGTVYVVTYDLYVGDSHKHAVEIRSMQRRSTDFLHHKWTIVSPNPSLSREQWSNRSSDESSHKGCPQILRLLLIIMSSPFGAPRRGAIRRSWLQLYHRSLDTEITTRFVIGIRNLRDKKRYEILNESSLYQDIILLNDMEDSYHNLTWKVLHTLTLVYREMDFHFLVKVDDDSYVQVNKLVSALRKMGCPGRLFWGYFMGCAMPELKGKWSELHWFICPHYIPYAMGGGYVLSQRLIQLLARFSEKLLLYQNEDVTMGAWMVPYDIERLHELRFNTEGYSHGCNNNYIITHKEKAATFVLKRKSMLTNGTICQVEKENKSAYEYNWTAPPMDCCERKRGILIPSS